MNRAGMFHQIPPLLQQQQMMMMGGNHGFWSFNSNHNNISPPPHHHTSSILPVSPNCHDTQQLLQPDSWSQLLLGGYDGGEEEDKKMEGNWEDQFVVFPSAASDVISTKRELENEYLQNQLSLPKSTWSTAQTLPPALVSPSSRSRLISKNMSVDDFSNHKPSMAPNTRPAAEDHKSNSPATGAVAKKPRVQGAFSAQSTLKVRKEKLGDRIAALHQIVSPFGKTDTASVLLEAIGYIRFLQSQIEALSSPYLRTGPGHQNNMPTTSKQPPALLNESSRMRKKRGAPDEEESFGDEEAAEDKMRDLRSRGLCLVPLSFVLHAGSEAVSGDSSMALFGAF